MGSFDIAYRFSYITTYTSQGLMNHYGETALIGREATTHLLKNSFELTYTPNIEGKPVGWMAKEDRQISQDVIVEYVDLKKRLSVETYYTNEFILC